MRSQAWHRSWSAAVAAVAAVAAISIGSACSARAPVALVVPSDIAWVAVLSEGSPTGSLRAIHPGQPIEVELPIEARAIVSGYRAEALAHLPLRDPETLEVLSSCGPALPRADLTLELAPDANAFVAREEPGALLAPASAHCDPAASAFEISSRNAARESAWCGGLVRPVRTGPCEAELELECLPPIRTPVTLEGHLCLGRAAVRECAAIEPAPTAAFAIRCRRDPDPIEIEIDFWPTRPEPRFTVTASINLLGPRPRAETSNPGLDVVTTAFLSDLVLLDQGAVVLDRGDVSHGYCSVRPDTTRLHFVDLDAAAAVRTATTPTCLRRLARDPGAGLLGVFDEAPPDSETGIELGRFDAGGRLLQRRPLPGVPGLRTRLAELDARALLVSARSAAVAIALYTPGAGRPRSLVAVYDLTTLEWRGTVDLPMSEILTGTVSSDGRFAFSDYEEGSIVLVDASGSSGLSTERFLSIEGEPSLVQITIAPQRSGGRPDRWLVFKTRRDREAYADLIDLERVERERVVARFPYHRQEAVVPSGAVSLGASKWVVGAVDSRRESLTDPLENRAVLTLLDLDAGAFLPSPVVIGHGAVTELERDARGRLWALLPWSAELLQIAVDDR
ncbi:MAG: hypothetical protein IT384_06625 [Deltaproteobacteria bacterium]|nr:hypothetical protein [Deltaproteobacteria bacterium]